MLRTEAFDAALDAFCANDDPERLRLLAVYGAANLRRMLIGVYETLRAAGRDLVLELGDRPSLEMRCKEWAEAARCLSADTGSSATHRETARQAIVIAESETAPHRLFELGGLKLRGERAASYEEARVAVEQAALDELAARDRDLLQELPLLVEMARRKVLDTSRVVTRTVPLDADAINATLDALEQWSGDVRTVIVP